MPQQANPPESASPTPASTASQGSPQTIPDDVPLTEDLALALLQHHDLPPETLERLSSSAAMKSRKVKLALVEHPRTPRHISLPMVRHLFTFELMQVALAPVTPADVKIAAEESLIHRLETVSEGERLSLARRASGRVAAELLLDPEARVIHTALDNPRLTEAAVFKALMKAEAPAGLVLAVCNHAKWSLRREVRIALLRNENTPLARALELARSLPAALVREVLRASRLPENIKAHLLEEMDRARDRGASARASHS
ncbi:MAG TPA: hypothetical protein VLV49_14180 [Terriglobales bacterium]|nr:hypothetical protein [Terriglobales bacterium]